jgi:hypothetical protein
MSAFAPSDSTHDSGILESIANAYFGALIDGNLGRVPWAADVILRAPLAARNPLSGREEVEDYIRPLAGHLGEVHIREIFISPSRNAMTVEAIVGPLHVMDKFVIRDGQIAEQQNFYDPRPILEAPGPGGLTGDERTLLLEKLQASRERVRDLLNARSQDALNRRPGDGGWTPLECAEHLVLSEEALLRIIRDEILSGTPNPALPLELQGRDGAVVAAMNDRSHKAKTFDFLIPRGRYETGASVLDAFLARRAATMDFVRETKQPVHYHAAPLEVLGVLDAYHWLLLIAAHTERHLEQMREALG